MEFSFRMNINLLLCYKLKACACYNGGRNLEFRTMFTNIDIVITL